MAAEPALRRRPLTQAGRDALFRRVASRYRGSGRFARFYVASKLRHDPVHRALLDLAASEAFGDVLDLGCGRGQLGLALLEAGAVRSVVGLDWNAAHLAQASQAARNVAFHAECRDLTRPGILPAADTVLIIDMLYQLDTDAQQAVLAAACASARRHILIRTADPGRGWRSAVTRTLEVIARPFWPHSGARVNAQAPAAIARMLGERGFSVSEVPCWEGTPFANVLLRAERSA